MTYLMSLLLILMVSVIAAAQIVAGSGGISGIVVDESGSPTGGATVSCSKQNEYTRDATGHRVLKELGFQRVFTVGSGGSFTFSELPPGRYHVCAFGPKSTDISGCAWEAVPVIELSSGASIDGITRRVLEGSLLTFRVSDPEKRVSAPDAAGKLLPERRLFIGVTNGLIYQAAELVSSRPDEHVFQLLVPRRHRLKPFIDSELTITDAADRILETRRPASVEITPGGLEEVTVVWRIRP